MADITFKGNPVKTAGDLPAVGSAAPDFTLAGSDLSDVTLADQAGKRVVLNIFPSIDTGVCATSVRTFNELAASLDNTTVVCASADLPFALGRFCGAEGIDNVTVGSTFRSTFADDYGTKMVDGPLAGQADGDHEVDGLVVGGHALEAGGAPGQDLARQPGVPIVERRQVERGDGGAADAVSEVRHRIPFWWRPPQHSDARRPTRVGRRALRVCGSLRRGRRPPRRSRAPGRSRGRARCGGPCRRRR